MLFICLLCGCQTDNVELHYHDVHPEWYNSFYIKETNVTMKNKNNWWIVTSFNSEIKQNLHKSERKQDNIFFMKTKKLQPRIKSHIPPNNKIEHHIKPWRDPESLFCDGDFLESYIGKPIKNDDRCIN